MLARSTKSAAVFTRTLFALAQGISASSTNSMRKLAKASLAGLAGCSARLLVPGAWMAAVASCTARCPVSTRSTVTTRPADGREVRYFPSKDPGRAGVRLLGDVAPMGEHETQDLVPEIGTRRSLQRLDRSYLRRGRTKPEPFIDPQHRRVPVELRTAATPRSRASLMAGTFKPLEIPRPRKSGRTAGPRALVNPG